MKRMTFVLAALLLAAPGCKKKGADCDKAIDHSMELSKADMQKMPGMTDDAMKKMRDIGVQHCKDDKWPDDAIKCMTDAATMADAQGCYSKLTPEQRHSMNKAAMEAMPAPAPGTTPPPTGNAAPEAPPAAAPAGSAAAPETGSAK